MKHNNYRWLLDHLTTALLVLDKHFNLVFMNSSAEDLLGQSFRQASELGAKELLRSAPSLLAAVGKCLQTGHQYTERELVLNINGERIITVDCTLSPLSDGELPAELLLEFQQVDRQLRINREELLLLQQNTSRLLIRNLAHEIKNPLGGLRGAAQLLEREFNNGSLTEYTQVIIGEADRLRKLVDRMLGPTQLPSYCQVNIHEVLERVRQLVIAEAGADVVLNQDYDPSIPLFRGDSELLIQAILNIARNAVQALQVKQQSLGRIIFRTRVQRQYTIGHKRHKLIIKLDIIDNGPGIPEELQEGIFYPMVSGREQGTGLGLSIAQGLINQHDGLIEFDSRPGKTVFTLLLPLEVDDGEKS